MADQPLAPTKAKERIRRVLTRGSIVPTAHAKQEMRKDGLNMVDVTNVLRGGVVDPAEWENGEWRYRVRTQRIVAVVAFDSDDQVSVVTAWRVR
jgi:hypothetical protein